MGSEAIARKLRRQAKRATELQPLPGTNPVPMEQRGYELPRLEGCPHVLDCLELATRNNWPGMSCGHCPKYIEKHGKPGARRKRDLHASPVVQEDYIYVKGDGLGTVDSADQGAISPCETCVPRKRDSSAPIEKARVEESEASTHLPSEKDERGQRARKERRASGRLFHEPFVTEEKTRALLGDQLRIKLATMREQLDELEQLLTGLSLSKEA